MLGVSALAVSLGVLIGVGLGPFDAWFTALIAIVLTVVTAPLSLVIVPLTLGISAILLGAQGPVVGHLFPTVLVGLALLVLSGVANVLVVCRLSGRFRPRPPTR